MNESLANAIQLRSKGEYEAARAEFMQLAEKAPSDPDINYHCAWVHDNMGLEREAINFYEQAIANGLSGDDLQGALLSLGSSYRCVGEYEKAVDILTDAVARFPANKALPVFLAMALHNVGKHSQAMETLLTCVAETTADKSINKYKRAILHYAQDIDAQY